MINMPTGIIPSIRKMKDFTRGFHKTSDRLVSLAFRLSQCLMMKDGKGFQCIIPRNHYAPIFITS